MNEAQANAVYDLLIQHAGADEWQRQEFVLMHAEGRCDEFRFIGWLGSGGKFWRHRWQVSAYPEDLNGRPGRQAIIDVTNAALAALQAEQEIRT